MSVATQSRPAKLDSAAGSAVEVARAAALDAGGASVGEYLGAVAEAQRVVTHAFAASVPGYRGWQWAVTVARAARSNDVTVDEVVLRPGDGALLAPPWVPWNERLRPGDLAAGDVLPAVEDDPRLVPSYVQSDDPGIEEQLGALYTQLGMGRERVLSREGRLDAADRWQHGDGGPDTPMARQAPAHCGSCGFLLLLAGSLGAAFGVCGNDIAPRDGEVVSLEYGCGAHSQAVLDVPSLAEPMGDIFDDGELIELNEPITDARSERSGSATLPAVLAQDEQTEDADAEAGQTGPEPDPVLVSAEPVVEGQ